MFVIAKLGKMNVRMITIIVPSACLLGTLVGCERPMTKADVQGTWSPDKASQKLLTTGSACQMVLKADGTIVATVPDYLLKTSDKATGGVMSGVGVWALSNNNKVRVIFDTVDGNRIDWGSNKLEVRLVGDDPKLLFSISEDEGRIFVFDRH